MNSTEYDDYYQILEAHNPVDPVDYNGYDSVAAKMPDPLSGLDIPFADEPPLIREVKKPEMPDVKEVLAENRDYHLKKQAKEIGLDNESAELAAQLKLIKVGDHDHNVEVPEEIQCSKLGMYCHEAAASVRYPYGSTFLTALACWSAATSLCYAVEYPDGTKLPLGIYACISQPPSTGKSRVLNIFASELNVQLGKQIRRTQEENLKLGKNDIPSPVPSPVMSNATPEAVEVSMSRAESGRFVIMSSEQGAIDRILNIGVTDRATDNDIVLKGFVGEFHGSARVNRVGYHGEVFGTIALISQPGTAVKVIQSSGGQGIAERFLFAQESALFGFRTKNPPALKKESKQGYNARVQAIFKRYFTVASGGIDQLTGIRLCEDGYHFLFDTLHDVIEPKLKTYNDAGAHLMTGALGKIDQQIMKIAANLHIYENLTKGGDVSKVIDLKWVKTATVLAFEMLSKLEMFLVEQGEIGEEAKVLYILSKYDNRKELTRNQLIDLCKNNRRFSGREDVKSFIDQMIQSGDLREKGKYIVRG